MYAIVTRCSRSCGSSKVRENGATPQLFLVSAGRADVLAVDALRSAREFGSTDATGCSCDTDRDTVSRYFNNRRPVNGAEPRRDRLQAAQRSRLRKCAPRAAIGFRIDSTSPGETIFRILPLRRAARFPGTEGEDSCRGIHPKPASSGLLISCSPILNPPADSFRIRSAAGAHRLEFQRVFANLLTPSTRCYFLLPLLLPGLARASEMNLARGHEVIQ